MEVECKVSLGELVDKISILEIKLEKISDQEKLKFIAEEHQVLTEKLLALSLENIEKYKADLVKINSRLWDIEDAIREQEKAKNFSEKFIELARAVYHTNDQRFEVKNRINEVYGSQIREMKSYEDYS